MSDNRDILILEAGADQVRLSLVRDTGQGIDILDSCSHVTAERRDDRIALQDQNLVDALAKVVSERDWVGKDVICLISGGVVSTQYFDMPGLKGPALRQAVLLKLGQQLHFPIAQAIVDVHTVSSIEAKQHHQIRVAVTAVQRDAAQAVVDAAARFGLRLVAASSASGALAALAADRVEKSDALQGVLHFGDRTSTLVVRRAAAPAVTSELAIGMDDFTKALMRPIIAGDEVIQLDLNRAMDLRDSIGIPDADQQIESLGITGAKLYPLIEPTLQKISQQLTQWLSFAATMEGGNRVTSLKVTGPGSHLNGFAEAVGKRLNVAVGAWNWLDGVVKSDGISCGLPIDSFAVAIAACKHRRELPDLIPPDVRKAWKIRRVRRSTALIGPIVAAVILGFTFLFNQVQNLTQNSFGAEKALHNMQTLADTNARWADESGLASGLRNDLKDFSQGTPSWEGLFKELSQLLPSELRATKYVASLGAGGIHLRVDSNIYTTPTGRDFDEVIEQTLRSFERSPFFEKVQLLNSTRSPADGTHVETGVMAVDLQLAYPRPKNPTEAKPG